MAINVDAVVIGAGVNRASIAFNLAKRGLKNVAIVERFTPASGGPGKSGRDCAAALFQRGADPHGEVHAMFSNSLPTKWGQCWVREDRISVFCARVREGSLLGEHRPADGAGYQ
jgi:glycine/D-amino acid oxidase-like deaminating enzyme